MRKNFLITALLLLLWLPGCTSLQTPKQPRKEAVFRGSIQNVWLATEKVLSSYPIIESNVETGVIRTDYLRGGQCWRSPGETEKLSAGIRCQLTFHFVKMPKGGIRVRITKNHEIIRDFVAPPEPIPTDGLEELSLLYRIDRELTLERELSQSQKHNE